MTVFFLRLNPLDRTKAMLEGGGLKLGCAIGRSGVITRKREGDGGTPRTTLKPLRIFMRQDQWHSRAFDLPIQPIKGDMGWCDDVRSARYNRLIRIPFAFSHETLWREDRLYDIVIETSWNAQPAIRGFGSAIFIHLARPDLKPTEGCIALNRKDMALFLTRLRRETRIIIA
jgi:L,D-peptidoglycan transpeptidase YkuD (ErfK/YbiS/YcfS/YnhG family)